MTELESLRAEYLAAVERLIQKYPGQEQNRAMYTKWANEAKLGLLTKRVRSKGHLTDAPKGTVVLWLEKEIHPSWPDEPPCLSIWAPRPDGSETRTIVDMGVVKAI